MKKHWYTNGVIDKTLKDTDDIPEGFYRGRTNYGPGTINTRWITNGEKQLLIRKDEELPEGFRYGKLPDTDEHKANLSKALKGRQFTSEWCKNISKSHLTESYRQKIESTCLERYGVKNTYNRPEIKAKANSKEAITKRINTMRKNNTFYSSKPEDEFYEYLLTQFDVVYRQYNKDPRYPFACDFYIPQYDLFIECNFHWSHNDHFYDENNELDVQLLNKWKNKHSRYYDIAIHTWSIKDVLKKQYGDKINYLVLWNQDTMIDDFNKLKREFLI